MARRRPQTQRDELAAFVKYLFEISPFEVWADFARAAGVNPVSISKWQTGNQALDGYNLLSLMKAADYAPVKQPATVQAAAADAAAEREAMRAIRAGLAQMVEVVDALDERLAE